MDLEPSDSFCRSIRPLNAEALVSACAHAGKHYVDLTGESAWLSGTIIPKYDYLATRTGACIVPSCGMDSVPSDITLYYALKTLQASRPDLDGFSSSLSFFKFRAQSAAGHSRLCAMRRDPAAEPD